MMRGDVSPSCIASLNVLALQLVVHEWTAITLTRGNVDVPYWVANLNARNFVSAFREWQVCVRMHSNGTGRRMPIVLGTQLRIHFSSPAALPSCQTDDADSLRPMTSRALGRPLSPVCVCLCTVNNNERCRYDGGDVDTTYIRMLLVAAEVHAPAFEGR